MEKSWIEEGIPAGTVIDGRYKILSKLGQGGFATVYLASQIVMGREVAIKVMSLKPDAEDQTYMRRFAQEAQIAAKLRHSSIVNVHDFGVIPQTKQPYFVMELLKGNDLETELREHGPLSKERVFKLFLPVLDGLAEGHRMGIIHKDLKPANLYLIDPGTPQECLKITDFGVARVSTNTDAKLTTAGQMMGTPRYLAPEYIRKQIVTPAIDVYQIALIMSEALSGRPAVTGNCTETMIKHAKGELDIDPFLKEGLVGDVFRRALCLDYKLRYKNCEEFAKALDMVAPCFGCEETKTTSLHLAKTKIGGDDPLYALTPPDAPSEEKPPSREEIPQHREELLYSSSEDLKNLKQLRTKMIIVLTIGILLIIGVIVTYIIHRMHK